MLNVHGLKPPGPNHRIKSVTMIAKTPNAEFTYDHRDDIWANDFADEFTFSGSWWRIGDVEWVSAPQRQKLIDQGYEPAEADRILELIK